MPSRSEILGLRCCFKATGGPEFEMSTLLLMWSCLWDFEDRVRNELQQPLNKCFVVAVFVFRHVNLSVAQNSS